MRTALPYLVIAPFALAVLPAQAQVQNGDPVASAAIARGEYSKAEQSLLADLRIHPGRPELMLNLAAIYARTGRTDEARDLYTRVLAKDDVLMDLPADRVVGSHAVAQTGLKRLSAVQLTTR